MQQNTKWKRIIWKSISYILVAAVSSAVTFALWGEHNSKLSELENIINRKFIGEADMDSARDAAASAMV